MSENSEPLEPEQQIAQMSHRRILRIMAAVAFLGGLLSFYLVSHEFGWGVFLGGILSLVNYYWLKVSLRGVFDKIAGSGEKPRFLAAKYFLRYAAFISILVIVFLTKVLPIIAVLLGLASFAVAIIVEALILLFSSFFKK
jgi:hypothetical protein